MFKQKNKEPFGTKLRALGVLSVGSRIRLFGLRSKCSAPCVLTSCTSPLTSSLQRHASSLLRKYHSKRDTYVYMPVHFYHLANCIRQHQVLSTWPFFVAVSQSHRPFPTRPGSARPQIVFWPQSTARGQHSLHKQPTTYLLPFGLC